MELEQRVSKSTEVVNKNGDRIVRLKLEVIEFAATFDKILEHVAKFCPQIEEATLHNAIFKMKSGQQVFLLNSECAIIDFKEKSTIMKKMIYTLQTPYLDLTTAYTIAREFMS